MGTLWCNCVKVREATEQPLDGESDDPKGKGGFESFLVHWF